MIKEKTTFYDEGCAQMLRQVKIACHSYTGEEGFPFSYRINTDSIETIPDANKVLPLKVAADLIFWVSSSALAAVLTVGLIYRTIISKHNRP